METIAQKHILYLSGYVILICMASLPVNARVRRPGIFTPAMRAWGVLHYAGRSP
jgi:hypothetical protein